MAARNGQSYPSYPSYPSYSPPYQGGSSSSSGQPLLIIIPTGSSSKGSSYKAQPASYSQISHAPEPNYPQNEGASYADRSSQRRTASRTRRRNRLASQGNLISNLLETKFHPQIHHRFDSDFHVSRATLDPLYSNSPEIVAPRRLEKSGDYQRSRPQMKPLGYKQLANRKDLQII